MKLRDLGATFIKYEAREPHAEALLLHPDAKVAHWVVPVDRIEDAHGVQFRCPRSAEALGHGHAHMTRLWFFGKPVDREVGMNAAGKIIRFRVVAGTTIDTLTLAPSVPPENDLCGWTGSILAGEAGSFEKSTKTERKAKR